MSTKKVFSIKEVLLQITFITAIFLIAISRNNHISLSSLFVNEKEPNIAVRLLHEIDTHSLANSAETENIEYDLSTNR